MKQEWRGLDFIPIGPGGNLEHCFVATAGA